MRSLIVFQIILITFTPEMNILIGIGGSSYPLTRENRPPFPIFLQMVGVTNRVDMDFLEKDLEEIIYTLSQTDEGRQKLESRGLSILGKMYRQISLAEYGRLDLLAISVTDSLDLNVTVYELKQGKVGTNALYQACRYLTALRKIIRESTYKNVNCKAVLIGREIEKNGDFTMLYNFLDFATVVTYKYCFDGVWFTKEDKNYVLSNSDLDSGKYKLPICDLRDMISEVKDELPF